MPVMPIRCRRRLVLMATALLAGCGGGGGGEPSLPASIAVSVSATTASALQGTSSPVTVTLARTNFTGDVSLTADGLPAGVTATFAPATLSGSATSSVLTLAASASATPGTGTIVVRATGSGVSSQSSIAFTVSAAPSFALSAPATLSIAGGTSANATITLARTNFTGAVALAATGLPSGATATFAPNPTSADASVMTVSTGSATPGTYSITITGAGTGAATRSVALSLTITAPAPPSYTLTPSSTSLTITAGASGPVGIAIGRTNFTGDVTLAVGGLPSGATATISPNPVSATTSTLTIASGTAAAGTYTLTLTGTAAGLTDRTATVSLTITPVGTPGNVIFTFCANALPTWVGYQDGAGAWKQASIGSNNSYSFSITGKGGVAVVQPSSGNASLYGYELDVFYATVSELQSIGAANCVSPTPGTKTVNGSATGVGAGGATIALGQRVIGLPSDGAFTLDGVQTGLHDLLAVQSSSTTFDATNVIIRRSLDPPNGSTLPVLSFSSAEAVAPVRYTVTFPGVASSSPALVLSAFGTSTTSPIALSGDQFTAATSSYLGYAGAAPTDLHELTAEVLQGQNDYRGSISFFAAPGTRSAGLGPLLSTPSFSSLGSTPFPRLRVQFAGQAEYATVALGLFRQQNGSTPTANDRIVQILMTAGYPGALPATWDLSIPDLGAAPGFKSSWMLAPATTTEVAAGAYGGEILLGTPSNGTVYPFAQSFGTMISSAAGASASAVRISAAQPLAATQLRAQTERVMRIAHNRARLRALRAR